MMSTSDCNESGGNISQNNENQTLYKRPRGRPKVAKPENSAEKSLPKRPRGRPKGSKTSRPIDGEGQENMVPHSDSMEQIDSVNKRALPQRKGRFVVSKQLNTNEVILQKRGKGRPKGSLNKKNNLKRKRLQQNSVHEKRGKGRPKGVRNKHTPYKVVTVNGNEMPIYKDLNVRDIPKNRFDEAVEILNNPDHPLWEERNGSCNKSIHRYFDKYTSNISDQNLRLKFARQFLLRRDWVNLSKVLSISLEDGVRSCNSCFPLFTKYAAICLAHTDKQQFNKFIQSLFRMETDGEKVLQKCSQISAYCSDEDEE